MTPTATGPRDLRDAKRLAELEVVIERGKTSFVEVGEALLEVRDSKLYRLSYETFGLYCKGRWGFTDRRARQLMEATETVRGLPTGTTVPTTESQARELTAVLREHGPEIAAEVMAEAGANGHTTAETVRAAAAPFRPSADQWAELEAVVKSLRAFSISSPEALASAVPARRRASTARSLRDLGTYLGHIALLLEGMDS